ncbi:MAG TPA: cytochrome c [Chthoniobacteraceae bacterium]|nr:cytochrome c [Chthoniobacteraceae bacterium]
MLRYFFALFIFGCVVVVLFAGPRGWHSPNPPLEIFPDMDHQPKFQPQHPTTFFADGRAARKPVEGTIPIGYELKGAFFQAPARNATFSPAGFTDLPDYFNTGKFGDLYGDGFPEQVKVDEAFVKRGQERFNIHCSPCHGKTGQANGVVSKFGLVAIANLQDERIRTMPDGQVFSTISNGKNTMGAYGPNIAIEDRWAIVSYLRALQKSQSFKLADLPAEKQKELQSKQ